MSAALKAKARATYADLEAVPRGKVAELIGGQLYVFPRPAPRHATAASRLMGKLSDPFDLGDGGPGGWRILIEPEVRFPDPTEPKGFHVIDPDLAGWRRERMPEIPETAYIDLAPDWICEVLSPSTEEHDRRTKMPLYAENGVRWAWLVDPIARSLEVYILDADRRWNGPTVYRDAARVHAIPFELKPLDLSVLWA
jgi:Uma2 family endonuclease